MFRYTFNRIAGRRKVFDKRISSNDVEELLGGLDPESLVFGVEGLFSDCNRRSFQNYPEKMISYLRIGFWIRNNYGIGGYSVCTRYRIFSGKKKSKHYIDFEKDRHYPSGGSELESRLTLSFCR